MCDVDEEAVVAAVDAPSIYDIPKVLHREGLDAYVVRRLGLAFRDVQWQSWDELLRRVHRPAHRVEIALVGKYVDLPDAYLSVTEALRAGGFANDARVDLRWVASDTCETPEGARRMLAGVDAVCIPGGFGVRGIEGKVGALRWARENQVPALGLCLGLQCMVIEFARHVAGLEGASSTEFDPQTPHPVIATMEEQKHIVDGRRRPRRHDAARLLSGRARRGLDRARGVRRRAGRGAAPAPLRGEQRVPAAARGGRAGRLGRLARPVAGGVRRAAPRGAPVLRVDPGPPRVQVAARPRAPAVPGLVTAALAVQSAQRLLEVAPTPDLPEVPVATVGTGAGA